jgi:TusA-related sulfurtransferase
MNTLINNKTKKMKKNVILVLMALLMMPLTSMAQDIFAKYSDNADVTYVNIKPKMFQMLAKMDIDTDDPETKEYMEMVNSISSLKTIITEKGNISSDIAAWVNSKSRGLEELMEVKDEGTVIKFFIKEGKDEDHVEELLIFVNGLSNQMEGSDININGKERKFETIVVSLTGDIDLNQISKLTKQMNIPGGEHLDDEKKN